jgi:uncharacterized phage infection (PIP) family protein YhgE
MSLGKTTTVNAGAAGKTYKFDPSIVSDQLDAIKKEKEMLRGILEGEYDEFADKDYLQSEADKLKEAIAKRKLTLDVYSKDQGYRDLIHAEDPTKMVKADTTTRTNPSRILDLEKPSTTTEVADLPSGKIKLPPRPGTSEDEKLARKLKEELRAETTLLNQNIAKKQKASDLVNALKDLEQFGGNLNEYPDGETGQTAKRVKDVLMRYGQSLGNLPGEGTALEKLKNYLLKSKYGDPTASLPSIGGNVVDIKATEVPIKGTGLGKAAKGLMSGLLRGVVEAPKYEFLNPPSAGPSDPDDPIYQFERGLITQDEFIRRLKQ